jgi:hypothetical protein
MRFHSYLATAFGTGEDLPVIDLRAPRNGRRFALISKVLSAMGISHGARVPLARYLRLGTLEKSALAGDYCTPVLCFPRNPPFVICDHDQVNHETKVIRISYDAAEAAKSGLIDSGTMFLPILFHPDMISRSVYRQASKIAENTERNIGILFAGNCDPKTYDNQIINSQFGLLNRHKLHELARRLPERLTFFPESRAQFEKARASGKLENRLVWIDTNRFRIPQQEWLHLMGDAQYFVSTPGVRYPYCQNLNEAMACGAVPIVEYPDLYVPQLEHHKNCIAFHGTDGFAGSIEAILATRNEREWQMRSADAIQYHQLHLSLEHASQTITAFLDDDKRRRLDWIIAGRN